MLHLRLRSAQQGFAPAPVQHTRQLCLLLAAKNQTCSGRSPSAAQRNLVPPLDNDLHGSRLSGHTHFRTGIRECPFPDTGVIIPCLVRRQFQVRSDGSSRILNTWSPRAAWRRGLNLIFSLYFSLLAGKTKTGERFAADSKHHQITPTMTISLMWRNPVPIEDFKPTRRLSP